VLTPTLLLLRQFFYTLVSGDMVYRTRKQRGAGYQFGPAITHGLINNYGQEIIAGPKLIPDCLAAAKTDTLGYSGPKGLPGLSGGGAYRNRKQQRKHRKQSGGRYGFVDAAGMPPSTPALGGLAPMTRIACESSTPNPLNPGPHTPSTAPMGAASDPKPFVMAGGAVQGIPATVGFTGTADAAAYYAPTAGYSNAPSTQVSSTGSPWLTQIPYGAREMTPACIKTGGGMSRRRRRNRKTRKGRKGRKTQRKH
jgi:hypothetical protein